MPKSLEREEDALQKILSLIEEETLDPARQEAERIITEAKERADEIINQALKDKEQLLHHGRESINHESELANVSLGQAGREAVEALRQKVQDQFFEKNLASLLDKKMQDEDLINKIIDGLLEAMKKEGLNSRFTLILPKTVSPKQLSEMVANKGLASLESDAKTGELPGGVQIKLKDKQILLDFSSKAIFELLASYIRNDLREILFGKEVG